MNDPAKQLQELGVNPWLDNITRAMLRDGTLADYTGRFGLRDLTSNPNIFDKAIKSGNGYVSLEVSPLLAAELQQEGEESFTKSWRDLLSTLERMAQAA